MILLCASFQLGTYDPIPSKDGIKEICLNSERIKYWISVGAQPSDRVAWILGKVGILPPRPIPASTNYTLPKFMTAKK